MATLQSFSNINHNIKRGQLCAIKALHMIAFDTPGEPRKHRKSLRTFAGFHLDPACADFQTKISNVEKGFDLPDLVAVCHLLDLDYGGDEGTLAQRICSFLNTLTNLEPTEDEDDDDEEVDDDPVIVTNTGSDPASVVSAIPVLEEVTQISASFASTKQSPQPSLLQHSMEKMDISAKQSFSLSYRDVEDSIRRYDGSDIYPVERWIDDFEEMAQIMGWNELQKLIFAKKSLTGLAKLFVQSQHGVTTWYRLKELLLEEFSVKVDSAQIHRLLMTRRKRRDETTQEYVLHMREIGSRAHIEETVIIRYIIDGLGDDTANKIILYGARTFQEFKEKVKIYDQILKSTETQRPKREWKPANTASQPPAPVVAAEIKTDAVKRPYCFSCRTKGHRASECPDKKKGTKCFQCKEFGHIASKCPGQTESQRSGHQRPATANLTTIVATNPRNSVDLRIDDTSIVALFDTGSDISALREDVYRAHFSNIALDPATITLKD